MIIPAIDLIDGQVVRLYQGSYDQTTEYSFSPLALRDQYAAAGSPILHVVDLSGAKDASQRQLNLLTKLMTEAPLQIQVGGGVRSEQDVQQLLAAGASRVVIGSLAIRQPELVQSWLRQYGGERIVLALDVAINEQGEKTLPSHGWIEASNVTLEQVLDGFIAAGAKHVLCTDISKDGTLTGSNVTLYQELTKAYPQISWQASGGIGCLDDIRALRGSGVAGVILGRSLLEGKFTLQEAIECWQNG
ncbi:1-(5-phosphoribosyl)-5-[(5-phosphoribosylamino)methylideneamino]imidazole-4-carboxamide isomerase [Alkalimonas collagenimarina]|uniref:1-(5-phosphoribosyl)-5-[(5-phosphoribosylamino)methylideneamino] imidazole-4-carboxamide isomerase n=1 Tax=Alkalimonas collagenimarina TaxID=400390 RepID=A0ABT9GUA1_9GAMM|nr:1-(5-phosphoribosyl)-5-[(5-phosphoribosylamino)methylideneamino]imidazole-4-carboxamide isomerase [Alkalimonas collagenimarina]MDP4534633.1 1-(5-phosphoribosyl)-5-[(5-phosphoribosylamino)methylideneamino]imidazole-4-carboxamide isomerase [Alkalimonas collagenimarina]